MSNKNNNSKWIVFGAGNLIFDIVDAIESNGQSLKAIVVNQKISDDIKNNFKDKIVPIENFRYEGENAIFGFISAEKSILLKNS